MTQPKALFLADVIESDLKSAAHHDEAAAELRRLSIENDALGLHLSERMKDLAKVEAHRDALLEALKGMRHKYGEYACSVCDHADAAIKAVEGEHMTTITLPRAVVEQALEALAPWMDSDHTVQHAAYHALRTALAQQRLTDAQQEMERSIESLKAALAQQAEPKPMSPEQRQRWEELAAMPQQAEPVEPVATVTECEACFTPDVCQLRGTCDYYTASQMRIAAPPQQAEPVEPVAWLYTGIKQDGTEHGPHLVWKPEYMDAMSASKGAKATPLYTSPPQRQPLTEGVLMGVYIDFDRAADPAWSKAEYLLRLFRAVERAHDIPKP